MGWARCRGPAARTHSSPDFFADSSTSAVIAAGSMRETLRVADRDGPAVLAAPPPADLLLLTIAIAAVSTSAPLIAATAAPTLAIALWRNAMASGVLVPWAMLRHRDELRGLDARERRLAVAAGVFLAAHFATWVPSVRFTSVASATALVATQPIWAALIARRAGHHIPRRAWIGIALAVTGAALVTGVDVTVSGRALVGDVLATVGGLFAAAYVTIGGEVRRNVSTTTYTTVCYLTAALALLVVCVIGQVSLAGYSADAWLKIAAITVGAQFLGHSLANRVLRTTSPIIVSLSILFEVPGASLIALVWLGQHPPVAAVPGLVLLLVGVATVITGSVRGAAPAVPGEGAAIASPTVRARRTVLSVPGSNPRMVEKAQGLPVDEVLLDLEDAVAPDAKDSARGVVVEALRTGNWDAKTVAVRVNDWTTTWTHRDVIDVVGAAGVRLDTVVLPKVESPRHVAALDLLLSQVERASGRDEGAIGLELQIESARGLMDVDAIAAASSRTEALVYGPADFMASLNMRSLVVGEQPPGYDVGDAYHYVLMRILVTARAHGLQAIDGPHLQVRDLEGFRRSAARSAALGYDGKWVLHPDQVDAGNEAFTPGQDDYERAEEILDAYEHSTSEAGGRRGAVMLGDVMIDEASRKMALVVAAKGRAAGLRRSGEGGD